MNEKATDLLADETQLQDETITEEQPFDDYLLDVIETNTEINSNLDSTNEQLTDVTQQLESMIDVIQFEKEEEKEKQEKQSLARENDLKFQQKLLDSLNVVEGENEMLTELKSLNENLAVANEKQNHLLVENSILIMITIVFALAFQTFFNQVTKW